MTRISEMTLDQVQNALRAMDLSDTAWDLNARAELHARERELLGPQPQGLDPETLALLEAMGERPAWARK